MKLRELEFGKISNAPGTLGFKCDGTEYWYHRYALLRPDFTGATKVAKTATLFARTTKNGANMDLDENLRPTEMIPRSIAVNPFLCCAVNAVGLANPGLQALLDLGIWQSWRVPFYISLMAVEDTRSRRIREWEKMMQTLIKHKREFKAPFALQKNHSCPNVQSAKINYNQASFASEVEESFDVCAKLGVPQVPKFSVPQISMEMLMRIGNHKECDAVLLSNTIPWGQLPLWVRLASFGTPFSPLRWRGIKQDGGYTGPFLRHQVLGCIRELREYGFKKPIIACGGITKPIHIIQMRDAGASAVEIGLVAMLRARRVPKIIAQANTLIWKE